MQILQRFCARLAWRRPDGADTASNVLFGGLRKTSATRLGLNPILMAAANFSGGAMGKTIDAQSIAIASTAIRWHGHEGEILRMHFSMRSHWHAWPARS